MIQTVGNYLQILGSAGGIIYLFAQFIHWFHDRYRIIIHKPKFSGKLLNIELENPSNQINSLKKTVLIEGCLNGKIHKEEFKIFGDRQLPPGKSVLIEIPCKSETIFFWYTTITIYPTKSKKVKIKFKNCEEQFVGSWLRFIYEKRRFLKGKIPT